MKFFIILALGMLISFSMEIKLRSRSKSKQVNNFYIDTPIYIESLYYQYLKADGKYGLYITDEKETTWTIKNVGNERYNIISDTSSYICIHTIYNILTLCDGKGPDSEWRLISSGDNSVSFQGKTDRYLIPKRLGFVGTSEKMDEFAVGRLYRA